MPMLFIYLIKANIVLTLFYLAYRFGLRRLTFYTLNRFFLLFGIAFSAALPLVDIHDLFRNHRPLAGSVINYTPDWHSLQQYVQPESFTMWDLTQYIFWAGVMVMAVRFFVQLLSLLHIHLRTTDGTINKEKVKLMQDRINPFSFFRNIYINPSLHTDDELKDIIAHEHIHVKGWHTVDIIAGELNNIFYWFNPGAWLMKVAIRENLEFITDRKILQSGIDAKAYQYSLIKVSSIPFAVPLVNNFNLFHLKQRITMMNKKRSSHFHVLRYLFLLPVIVLGALMVTSSQGQSTRTENKMQESTHVKHRKDTSITFSVKKVATHSPGNDTISSFAPSVAPAHFNVPDSAKPLIIINNKVMKNRSAIGKVSPNEIDSVVVIKDHIPLLIEQYGQNAKNGIIKIYTKKYKISPTSVQSKSKGGKDKAPDLLVFTPRNNNDTAIDKPLYIVDGQLVESDDFEKLNPKNIYSISVLKGEQAGKFYGAKGKSGVILIVTKANAGTSRDTMKTSR
jgi:hypothetical protein